VEWIPLVQDRDRWVAVVNAVMNLRILVPLSWIYVTEVKNFGLPIFYN
jgi:hypothetical protein